MPCLVPARVVRAAVAAIWNAITVAVAIDTIPHAVTITVIVATILRNQNASG